VSGLTLGRKSVIPAGTGATAALTAVADWAGGCTLNAR
jgi:hypothetical protein